MLEKYGWSSACRAVNLRFGSRVKRDLSKDIASFGAAVKISSKGIAGTSSHMSPLEHNGRVLWSGQLTSVGVPKTVKIVSSCEISEFFPCKKGRRKSNSAKIHPTLQMSAAEEYSLAPKSSSGGLYHRVMACGDSRVLGVPYMRARPKSANFIVPSLM